MERMLERDLVQCMGIAMDWGKLLGSYTPPLLSRLSEEVLAGDGPTKKDSSIRMDILGAEPEERRPLVEEFQGGRRPDSRGIPRQRAHPEQVGRREVGGDRAREGCPCASTDLP
jgi:hypothetical protein